MRTIKCGTDDEVPKNSLNPRFEVDVGEGGNDFRKEAKMATYRCCIRLPRLLHSLRLLHTVAISAIVGLLLKLSSLDTRPSPSMRRMETNLTLAHLSTHLTLSPDICGDEPLDVVTIVHSAVSNLADRQAVRSGWGSSKKPWFESRVAFILGRSLNLSLQKEVEGEAAQFGDIVQADFIDSYRNMSYKNLLGLAWLSSWCPQAKLVAKTDDDYFVDLYQVMKVSSSLQLTTKPKFLACHLFTRNTIFRNFGDPIAGRWAVTQEELPSSQAIHYPPNLKIDFYPPYCTGCFYMLTPATADALLAQSTKMPYLFIDDAWVTGFLASKANISHTALSGLLTHNPRRLLLLKAIQHPELFHKDVVTGPTERNPLVGILLERQARWCYQHRCKNQVYFPEKNFDQSEVEGGQLVEALAREEFVHEKHQQPP